MDVLLPSTLVTDRGIIFFTGNRQGQDFLFGEAVEGLLIAVPVAVQRAGHVFHPGGVFGDRQPPGPQRQIGKGVPQYRVLDSAQSTLFRSQSPYLPCLMVGGCQFVASLAASSWSRASVVRMYQDGSA